MQGNDVLEGLYQVVLDRKAHPQEGSYTCYLFDKGLDKILKKVGEESAETIIAAKNGADGAHGRPGYPARGGAGGAGAAQPQDRQPETVPRQRPQYLKKMRRSAKHSGAFRFYGRFHVLRPGPGGRRCGPGRRRCPG